MEYNLYLSASMLAVMERVNPLPPPSPGSGSGDLHAQNAHVHQIKRHLLYRITLALTLEQSLNEI
jgi:hypothetical protein